MNLLINDFFGKCDQIPSLLRIWLHLLKKSLMENFNFCALKITIGINLRSSCFTYLVTIVDWRMKLLRFFKFLWFCNDDLIIVIPIVVQIYFGVCDYSFCWKGIMEL